MIDYNYRLTTASKSEYLRCLEIFDKLGLPKKSKGDDWNCKFEILFFANSFPDKIITYASSHLLTIENI